MEHGREGMRCPGNWEDQGDRITLRAEVYNPGGNRERVSPIECINITGEVLDSCMIFEGKVQMRDWWGHFACGHIAVSASGWTTHELCLELSKKLFEPETRKHQKGEYRMLIFDGHASQISSEAIQFCMEQKIIVLCEAPRQR